jgi:uncharacterized protein (DUF433 family)
VAFERITVNPAQMGGLPVVTLTPRHLRVRPLPIRRLA